MLTIGFFRLATTYCIRLDTKDTRANGVFYVTGKRIRELLIRMSAWLQV